MIYGTEDWAREQIVTKAQAAREYRRHGLAAAALFNDLGDHPTYKGADVLDALGY